MTGAHVVVSGLRSGTITDSTGNFHFSLPGKGDYTLKVSFVGCTTAERKLHIETIPVPPVLVTLEDLPTMMNEVSIVDERKDRWSVKAPMRMETIPMEMIRDNPGQQITNVLDYISGVNLSGTTGIFGGSQVISMRGLSGNDQGRTLILLDGVPLNKADGGTVNWNRINRDNIGEMVVIKGPGPAKYGSSAMGGVIEMNSVRPEQPVAGAISASYGTYETFQGHYSLGGSVKTGHKEDAVFYNLNGFYNRSAGYNPEIPEYLEPGDTFTTNTYLREAQIGISGGYQFSSGHRIEAGAEFYNDKRGRGMQIYETGGAYDQHKNYMVRFRYTGTRGRSGWNVAGYYNREGFRRMNEFMSDGEYTLYLVESARTDLGLSADYNFKAGQSHLFTLGGEYKKGSVYGQDIYYTSTDLITNAGEIELYGAYLQDEMSLANGKVRLNAGLRFNAAVFHDGLFTIDYPSYAVEYLEDFQDTLIPRHTWYGFDPKLSVQYMFNPGSRIYFSFGKGFRAPNLDDLCRSGKRSDSFRISNPALGPENLYNIETGADGTLFTRLHLSASVYYSLGVDFIYPVATGDSVNMGYKISPVTQKRNISRVHIFGGEADADLAILRNMHLTAGYTLSLSRISDYDPAVADSASDVEGKSLVDVPVNKLSAGFTWTNRILSVNLLYKYVGWRWINDTNTEDLLIGSAKFPAYQTVGFRVWHTFFKKLTVGLNVDNLFDEQYIDSRYQKCPGRMIFAEINFTI